MASRNRKRRNGLPRGSLNEDQIERSFERMCSALGRRLMAGEITQEQHDTQYAINKRWCRSALSSCPPSSAQRE
jgi:hypothetical protein